MHCGIDPSASSLKAGDENRTHMTSLEGWGSTTELHPHYRQISGNASIDDIYYSITARVCQALFCYFVSLYKLLIISLLSSTKLSDSTYYIYIIINININIIINIIIMYCKICTCIGNGFLPFICVVFCLLLINSGYTIETPEMTALFFSEYLFPEPLDV